MNNNRYTPNNVDQHNNNQNNENENNHIVKEENGINKNL